MISERLLRNTLAEIGRIKIGGLDKKKRTTKDGKYWQAPVKFEHFVITTQERDDSGNFKKDEQIHSIIGDKPRVLKIRLLSDDIELNFRTDLSMYKGRSCVCRGNGETAISGDLEKQCPCENLDKGLCKPHGVLNCLLEDAMVIGGVYRFSTTSWNTIASIVSSLKFIKVCTGGKLAGIPLTMRYFKKTTVTKTGQPTTIPVVTIVFEGNPVQMLETAINVERQRIEAGIKMENIEKTLRLEYQKSFESGILYDDEIPEFHPDNNISEQPVMTIDDIVPDETETELVLHTEPDPKPEPKQETKQPAQKSEPKPKPEPEPEPEPNPVEPADAPRTEPTEAETSQLRRQIPKLRLEKKVNSADFKKIMDAVGVSGSVSSWNYEQCEKIIALLNDK